jgi:hypothetical protein
LHGLYDTDDSLWMGNDAGPLLYEDEQLAQVSAMICDRVLRQRTGRTRAKEWKPAHVTYRDAKPLLESAVEALEKLEAGL